MKQAWLVARSLVLWAVTWTHFVLAVLFFLVLVIFTGEKKIDWLIRLNARVVVFLSGARLRAVIRKSPDPEQTGFIVSNHVNVFDPFVLYATVPLHFRGLELESHFKVPIYGWFMKRFGNVPVPDQRTASGLKRTYRLTKEALDRGTNLLVFPEGGRTLDGRVDTFERGVFRMARQLGYPITPVSIVNGFRWKRKTSWMLRPAKVEVIVHETIPVDKSTNLNELRDRVYEIVSKPVHDAL